MEIKNEITESEYLNQMPILKNESLTNDMLDLLLNTKNIAKKNKIKNILKEMHQKDHFIISIKQMDFLEDNNIYFDFYIPQ